MTSVLEVGVVAEEAEEEVADDTESQGVNIVWGMARVALAIIAGSAEPEIMCPLTNN